MISILKWSCFFAYFFLSPPLCLVTVLLCRSSLLSVHHFMVILYSRMLWLCCGSCCLALCDVTPFSSHQLILSVALVCAVKHKACSGFAQHDINRLVDWRQGHCTQEDACFLRCVSTVFLCVGCGFLCLSVWIKTLTFSSKMNCSLGNCLTKTNYLYCCQPTPPRKREQLCRWFPWIHWTVGMDTTGLPRNTVGCEVWCVKGQPWFRCHALQAVWKQDGKTTWLCLVAP